MAKVTITFEDAPDGHVIVRTEPEMGSLALKHLDDLASCSPAESWALVVIRKMSEDVERARAEASGRRAPLQ